MRKFLLLFSLVIFTSGTAGLIAQPNEHIQFIREDLFYSDFDLSKSWSFYKTITAISPKSPLIRGYQAVSEALIAKYSWNPANKYYYLKHSQELLINAIKNDTDNLELRFLRLYIQRSTPTYLRMSKNIQEDKAVIMENLDQLNVDEFGQDIIIYILNYMSSPEVCTPEEITLIKRKLAFN